MNIDRLQCKYMFQEKCFYIAFNNLTNFIKE